MRLSDFNPPTEGDATLAIQAALDAAQGGYLEWDVSGRFHVNRLRPRNGTTIVMHGGVTLAKAPNTAGVLYMQDCEGVRILGNGAKVDGHDYQPTTAKGHTIYANGTTDCTLSGLIVDGATDGKDCLYVGLGANPNERLRIADSKFLRAKRNGISVVAGFDTLIEDCETAYATGAPGAGVDIEANFYGHVARTVLNRVHSHHNSGAGILSIFGTDTLAIDCDSHDNGAYGLAASSGGYQFAETVYRPNVDMIGVTGFDTATGTVFVAAQPPIGTPVNFSLRNGAQRPPELSGSYYVVSRHVGTNGIILGKSVRHSEVLAFSLPGAGIMSADPYQSDIRLRAFVKGQSDGLEVRGGRYHNNAKQGLFGGGAGKLRFVGAEVSGNGSNQVQVSYIRDVEIERLRISGGNHMGIAASAGGGRLRIADCEIDETGGRAVSVAEWTGAEVDRNTATNCGARELSSAKAAFHFAACLRPVVTRNRAPQAGSNTTTLYGIYAEGSVENGTFTGNDMTGGGTTPANALRVMSPTCTVSGNIGRDGLPA